MLDKEKFYIGCDVYFVNAVCKSIEYGRFIEFFDYRYKDGWEFRGIRVKQSHNAYLVEFSCLDYNIGVTNAYNNNATFLTLEEAEDYVKTL